MMRLSRLAEGLADEIRGHRDPEIAALTLDLTEVRRGTLFAARRDWYGDTHAQLEAAVAAGAAALLVSRPEAIPSGCPVPVVVTLAEDPALGLISDRFYGEPTLGLRVYGVTGTNGKSTVTWMVTHLLRALGEVPAMMSTLEYRLGERSIPASNTTPDALVIQRFAADARALGATALVLEVSSHALAIGRVAGVAFDSVGFTTLGRDHLDFHGTLDAYFEAKARLFDAELRAAHARGKRPAAAACVDEPAGDAILARAPGGTPRLAVTTRDVPASPGLRVVRTVTPLGLCGTRVTLEDGETTLAVDLPLLGEHNLANAGVAAAMVEGTHPDRRAAAWAAFADFHAVPGRLERVAPEVFVDYAHTPDAVDRVLTALRARTTDPITIVLGCGGGRDRGKRAAMGRAAAAADLAVLTSDNPRGEDPEQILDDMLSGAPGAVREADRTAAIAFALAGPGVKLIAGKGHERTQTIGARRFHLDDREEARRIHAALAAGVEPTAAPLSWGWATPGDAARAVEEARRRRGGLWVVAVEPARRAELEAAVARAAGPEAWLACEAGDVAERLAPRHRVLVLPAPAADLQPDAVVGAAVPDVAAALAALEPGWPARPPRPSIPTLRYPG